MREYFSDLVEAVKKALEGSEIAALDKERLQKAERIGPGCVSKLEKYLSKYE